MTIAPLAEDFVVLPDGSLQRKATPGLQATAPTRRKSRWRVCAALPLDGYGTGLHGQRGDFQALAGMAQNDLDSPPTAGHDTMIHPQDTVIAGQTTP